jgi:hypothetical protein
MGAVVARAAIGVDVLAEQRDLAHAARREAAHSAITSSRGRLILLAARVGHDAEGAVLAAAFHDRDEGRRAVDAGLRQAVELLDLREADVHHEGPAAPVLRRSSIISGRRCRVWGPNTRST